MANYLDETGLQRVRDKIDSLYRRKGDLIGTVMWWSGSISSIPSNARICNGQTLSSSTYATLYQRISTTYGGDSTNFALPDFFHAKDPDNTTVSMSLFIRATDGGSSFGAVGTKQYDAIRNISGTFGGVLKNSGCSASGAFSMEATNGSWSGSSGASSKENGTFTLNANGGSSSNNPMKGHAVATDSNGGIRPYNISLIPIIIVS